MSHIESKDTDISDTMSPHKCHHVTSISDTMSQEPIIINQQFNQQFNNNGSVPWEGIDESTNEPITELGPLALLNQALANTLGIHIDEMSPRHVEAGRYLVEIGVTPEIIAEAATELIKNDYTILGLDSVKKTALRLHAKKKVNNSGKSQIETASEVYG